MKFSKAALAMAISLSTLAAASSSELPSQAHPLRIEADFVEQCSGVDLPFNGMMVSAGAREDEILSCMLDHVMTTSAMSFGINEEQPSSPCFPPGYEDIETACQDSLSMAAYDQCKDIISVDMEESLYIMSMSMSMSMSMNVGGGNDHLTGAMLREHLCMILSDLTSEIGLECLEAICESFMPSGAPSEELSAMPSAAPTSAPSNSPTSAPSSAPSSSPTLIVTQPEVVQTSASTLSSATLSLALIAAASVFVF